MKKVSLLLLIFVISSSIFIYGVFVGTYKIFPYEQMNYIKQISLNEKTSFSDNEEIFEDDVSSLIHIENDKDIAKLREKLISYIWIDGDYPFSRYPTNVQTNISNPLYSDFKNLKQIDQINIEMEYGINSISYLFIPSESNNHLVIYHQGHAGDFYKGKKTIQFFLENNYPVLAFSMPLLGMNSQPVVEIENIGSIKLTSHEHFRFIESSKLSPLKFFVEPITISLNYIDENYDFSSYSMVGLSGGGWTATIYPAIDQRISESYSVAGSLPIYLRSTPKNYGDYEQWIPKLYQKVNYLDLYIMSAYGDNRKFIQIFNKFDPCCFSGESYKTYENEVKTSLLKLKSGYFEIYLDDTHKKHQISDYALDLIINSMNESDLSR